MLIFLLLVSVLLELLLYSLKPLWQYRQWIAGFLVVLMGFSSGGLAYIHIADLGALILIIGAFRVFNQLRIIENRMQDSYLKIATRRTGLIVLGFQVLVISYFYLPWQLSGQNWLMVFSIFQLAAAVLIMPVLVINLKKTKQRSGPVHYPDKELPTVTVAIPARNETAALEQCLNSLIANDYPKLEIIVLDDCSQDQTPEIIRSYAQKGVRFIQGKEAPSKWLAKNLAYECLSDAAEGELILFCGVDSRFGLNTIRAIVTELKSRQKSMLSLLPLRMTADAASAFIQPARYWWELALPRRILNRPPVLSTCWMINSKVLKKLGGFKAVQHTIIPEGYFARELIKTDGYSFLRASQELDLQTIKTVAEQRATTIRTLYPQIRRRPENALLLTIVNLGLFIMPFVLSIGGFWWEIGFAHVLAIVAAIILIVAHTAIVRVSNPPNASIAILTMPFAMLMELILGYVSMWKYEFSTVEWKGRNVCIPVMHTIPHLPKLESNDRKKLVNL